MTFSKSAKVVGVIAMIASIPLAALAGLAITNKTTWYCAFAVMSVALVGMLSALWFNLISRRLGPSRSGMCIAGLLSALATCLCFLVVFAFVASAANGGSWLGAMLVYTMFATTYLAPLLCVVGLLAGWIASARKFVL